MFNPSSDKSEKDTYGAPSGYTGETDRVSGEYHYKNGFTQQIYSDARYTPVEESAVPPRYYRPPEKPEHPVSPEAVKKRTGRGFSLAACALCLALGLAGGYLYGNKGVNDRINALEAQVMNLADTAPALDLASEPLRTSEVANGPDVGLTGELSPQEIYSLACRQVVGITTEITYSNFFGQTSSSAVSGTGLILSEDGFILTNYHVIEHAYADEYEITVITRDGTRYPASIAGVEPDNDMAVLKIDASGLTAAVLGNSDGISVGDSIYAVGNPLGELEFSMTSGCVSATDRLICSGESAVPINMFQVDAAVNTGNSGGPVYNGQGEVIGIVTAKFADNGVEGIGFAIPSNDASVIARELITKGYVSGKPSLGLRLDARYTTMYSNYYGLPSGAFVYSVDSSGCACKAGIRYGDIITAIGDSVITGLDDVAIALKQFSAGDRADVTVFRDGEFITVSVVFDEAIPDSNLIG